MFEHPIDTKLMVIQTGKKCASCGRSFNWFRKRSTQTFSYYTACCIREYHPEWTLEDIWESCHQKLEKEFNLKYAEYPNKQEEKEGRKREKEKIGSRQTENQFSRDAN
jgi:hypothetical protein